MKKKTLLIVLIILFFLISVLSLMIIFPLPCDYQGGWGVVKRTCDCVGIKVDTTHCPDCPDAGTSLGCVGIPLNNECYTLKGDYPASFLDEICHKQ